MAIATATYETQQLAKRFKQLVADEDYEIVSYAELSRLIGHNVLDAKGRSYLRSARRICRRDTGRLVDVVRGKGVKLLDVTEQSAIAPSHRKRVQRSANRSLSILACVQYDKLDDSAKKEHNAAASMFGAVQLFSRARSVEKIASAVEKAAARLSVEDTIKLFQNEKESS